MNGLVSKLANLFKAGRRCAVLGIGNVDRGDDGFGVALAEGLLSAGWTDVFIAGTTPEKEILKLEGRKVTDVLLADAVSAGLEPGAAVFMDAAGIEEKFPQVSTHRLSLGLVARMLNARFGCAVWLLGVQPVDKTLASGLSHAVEKTTTLLLDEMIGCRTTAPA